MKPVSGRGAVTSSIVSQPSARPASDASVVMKIPTAKPSISVRAAEARRAVRRRTRATPNAATAPNSGPITMAPMTRICESSTIAIPAINVARLMRLMNVQLASESSYACWVTSAHTTVSALLPGASSCASKPRRDIHVRTGSI